MNQKVFFFDPNINVQSFNENGLPGTEEIQKIIYKHQFPNQCSDRKYIVLTKFERSQSGIGSLINFIASFISLGIDSNKTTIYYPHSQSFLAKGGKCKQAGFDCFFKPISNCLFVKEEIDSNHTKFEKHSITDISRMKEYPISILPILKQTALPPYLYFYYWRAQVAYFLVRFNNDMQSWLNDFRNTTLVNPKTFYDAQIFIRHGDKYKEMKLIEPKHYMFPLELLSKLLNRKIFVFVSSDSQLAIDYFINLTSDKYEFSYYNFQRQKRGFIFQKFSTGYQNTLLSLADLWESKNSNYMIGTLSSNWNNLIAQLRLQYHHNMDLPYFEVGDTNCVTPSQCMFYKQKIDIRW